MMTAWSEDDGQELYHRARERMEAREYEAAILLFEQSAKAAPHHKTLELLGECRCLLGDFRAAIVPLAAATALNEQCRAPALLADAWLRLGEIDRAARFARWALERGPGNRLAADVLARIGDSIQGP